MKKILVPTDFSAQAENALRIATTLAEKLPARIQLLHVREPIDTATLAELSTYAPGVNTSDLFDEQLKSEAALHLNAIVLKHDLKDLVDDAEVKTGKVIRHILTTAEEDEIDLIVMGTKGASGLYEMLIGSNTEKVIRLATCPVLTVPGETQDLSIKKVVMALDLDEDCGDFVKLVEQWQAVFGFHLHVLHVNSPLNFSTTFQIEGKWENFLKKHPLKDYTFTILNEYAFEDGICRFADRIGADLIAMATHGRQGITRLLDGSVTERVVNQAIRPVLSYNLGKDE